MLCLLLLEYKNTHFLQNNIQDMIGVIFKKVFILLGNPYSIPYFLSSCVIYHLFLINAKTLNRMPKYANIWLGGQLATT